MAKARSGEQSDEGGVHGRDLAAGDKRAAARQVLLGIGGNSLHVACDASQIAALDTGIDVDDGPNVVVADDRPVRSRASCWPGSQKAEETVRSES